MAHPRSSHDPTIPDTTDARPQAPLVLVAFVSSGPVSHRLPVRGSVTLGRGDLAVLRIHHPSVSRLHAVLEIVDGHLTLGDNKSVNGVRIRGRGLGAGEVALLEIGEMFQIGQVSLVVLPDGVADFSPRSQPIPSGSIPVGTVVASPAMARLFDIVSRIAASDLSVLVLGETGVGKELIAEALHAASARASKPLVRINCAALSATLIEAELFGHERGAFTGATVARPGLIESAHGGTLLLDEVGELPLPLQATLLRVLEERSVLRVGAQTPRPIDVRFVAATHRDLRADVASGAFRRDLYYRLNGISLVVSPLRERVAEIRPLAEHFLAMATPPRRDTTLSADVVAALEAHDWPGNVRELRNVIARAALLAGDRPITPADLPDELAAPVGGGPSVGLRDAVNALERRRIEEALARTGGNQTHAAVLLGMPRRTLVTRLKQYGLGPRRDD